MRITVVGTGYVGLVSGACFSEFGFHVTCVDKDASKIDKLQKGQIPIYEPGLDHLVHRSAQQGRLVFTTEWQSIADSDVVMIAVGTPIGDEGAADVSAVWKVFEEIAPHLTADTVVVTKSTVPVGTCQKLKDMMARLRPDLFQDDSVDVASNPEFLREGSAIEDFMRPDRVVVGVMKEKARAIMHKLYRPLFLRETPMVWTTPESAEMIKYAANGFLALKIAFINELADVCEQVGADAQHIAKGMGLDQRIGSKFLNVSPGYGGSCFPKDTLALRHIGREASVPLSLVEAVIDSNNKRKQRMAERIVQYMPKNATVALLGITFKPNTDDYREAASLVIVPHLLQAGLKVRVYDPLYNASHPADDEAFAGVYWAKNAYDAAENVDGVVLLTEWNEFRGLDLERLQSIMKPKQKPVMVDLRNIYRADEMLGFHYYSLGKRSA